MPEIRYSSEFNKSYSKLKEKALAGNFEAKYIIGLIEKATIKLSCDLNSGTQISRKLWPEEYVQKFDVKNLWKINLDSNWRLVYTITGFKIDLFLIYLEYMSHKDYNRKFKY